MNKRFLYTILVSSIMSCGPGEGSSVDSTEFGPTVMPDIEFEVDVDIADFKIIERGDSTIYLRQLYEGLDGRDIQFNSQPVKSIEVRMKIDFGVLQYTIDDNPAYPLAFSYESKWYNLTPKDNVIEIPDFYSSKNSRKIFELLGFHNNDELSSFVLEQNKNKIRRESIKEQSDFYTGLIRDKEKYMSCCPGYIAQADKFINADKDTLDNFRDLALELTYNRLIIDIHGQLDNGDNFHKVIIEETSVKGSCQQKL